MRERLGCGAGFLSKARPLKLHDLATSARIMGSAWRGYRDTLSVPMRCSSIMGFAIEKSLLSTASSDLTFVHISPSYKLEHKMISAINLRLTCSWCLPIAEKLKP